MQSCSAMCSIVRVVPPETCSAALALCDSATTLSQDKNPNNREVAEKKFKQISEAYDVRATNWTSVILLRVH